MPGAELVLETSVVTHARRFGWKSFKFGFLGVRGGPDRIFGKSRRCVLIEFKQPGEVPTRQQEIRHAELRDVFGFEVCWTDSFAGACAILSLPLR